MGTRSGQPFPTDAGRHQRKTPEIPFWAPDSRRLGFFDGSRLKRIDINGGPAMTIADTGSENPGSGSWNQDDLIIFSNVAPRRPLFRLPAAGGAPVPVTELDKARGETSHWAPWFLPDGRHFLYLARSANPETSGVYVGDLVSKARKQVVAFTTRAIYVNPGYLLYVRERTLMAQRFDTASLQTTGDAIPVRNRYRPSRLRIRTARRWAIFQRRKPAF